MASSLLSKLHADLTCRISQGVDSAQLCMLPTEIVHEGLAMSNHSRSMPFLVCKHRGCTNSCSRTADMVIVTLAALICRADRRMAEGAARPGTCWVGR